MSGIEVEPILELPIDFPGDPGSGEAPQTWANMLVGTAAENGQWPDDMLNRLGSGAVAISAIYSPEQWWEFARAERSIPPIIFGGVTAANDSLDVEMGIPSGHVWSGYGCFSFFRPTPDSPYIPSVYQNADGRYFPFSGDAQDGLLSTDTANALRWFSFIAATVSARLVIAEPYRRLVPHIHVRDL